MHSYIIKITEVGDKSGLTAIEANSRAVKEKLGHDYVERVGEEGLEDVRQLIEHMTGGLFDGDDIAFKKSDVSDILDEIALSASESLRDWVYSRQKGTYHIDKALEMLRPDRGLCFVMPDRAPMNKVEFLIMLYDKTDRAKQDRIVLRFAGALDYHA